MLASRTDWPTVGRPSASVNTKSANHRWFDPAALAGMIEFLYAGAHRNGLGRAMQEYEYKVVPAPDRGEKTRGAKTAGDRYAQALTSLLNRMAREGWDYVRADMLPSEERAGLTRRTTVYHHMLVFRRALADMTEAPAAPRRLTADAPVGNAPRLESPAVALADAGATDAREDDKA